jgi:hypothetical protein
MFSRYRPLRVLEEKGNFVVFEAEDRYAANLRVEVRVYRWGSKGEFGPQWRRWRKDIQAMKNLGDTVTSLSTPGAGITVSRRIPEEPGKKSDLGPVVRNPVTILLAELLAALIVLGIFHILILEPGAGSALSGAAREACRGNLRHVEAALTMYYSDHGRYPAALSELVPDYLPKPLTCPSGGLYSAMPADSGNENDCSGIAKEEDHHKPGNPGEEKKHDEQLDPATLRCTRCSLTH